MLQFVLFAVTAVIVLIAAVIFLLPGSKKITTIPGPDPVDVLEGNFPDIQSAGSLHEFLLQLHQTYGPIASLWWGPRLTVSIASPKLFKEQSNVFDRPDCIFELYKPLIGEDSIQFTNGSEARRRHALYSSCYISRAVSHHFKLFGKLSAELIAKWATLPEDDHIPLRRYMFAFAIKSMLQASFGSYFHDDRVVHKLRQAYDFVWAEMEDRLRGGRIEASKEALDRFEKQKSVMVDIVREALVYRRKHKPAEGEQLFIDVLLEMDDENIQISDALTVLVAGLHTSGLALTWALYFLASHQDIQDRVFEELDMVLGENDVTPDNYNDLRYLHQVIDETLRCSVLAPYAARVQDVDIELDGHRIPAGTPVIHALGVVMMNPEIFPDPDRFDPDRFSDEMKKARPELSFKPFGFAGKRICPGYRFSLAEIGVLLAAIIRSFKVKLIEGQVVVPVHGLVTKPKEEIWISVCKRK